MRWTLLPSPMQIESDGLFGDLSDLVGGRERVLMTFRIVARCNELGIEVIFSSFSGNVPDKMAELHPDSAFYAGSMWYGFGADHTSLTFLECTDPFYIEIGRQYQRIQYNILKSMGYFQGGTRSRPKRMYLWLDQFNELIPSQFDSEYLMHCGQTQWESLQLWEYAKDPLVQITWVLQGWMFVNERRFWSNQRIAAYLDRVDAEDILILDLIAEKKSIAVESEEFFQHNYVWCFLHNFGGNHYLGGNLENVFYQLSLNEERLRTGEHLKGIGITMEGITNNEVLYEAVLSHSFLIDDGNDNDNVDGETMAFPSRSEEVAMMRFVDQFVASRYGPMIQQFGGQNVMDLYHEFVDIVYRSYHEKWGVTRSLMVMRPSMTLINEDVLDILLVADSNVDRDDVFRFEVRDPSTLSRRWRISEFQSHYIDYNFCALFEHWRRWMDLIDGMVADGGFKSTALSPTFSNDMAEITRQVLSDLFLQCYALWKWTWINNEYAGSPESLFLEEMMLGIIDDTDLLMGYFEHYRLDKWIRDARRFGKDREEADYLEMNARNLLTRWGPNAEITEYASREWNGLMLNYYKPRWEMFFSGATEEEIEHFEVQWQYQTVESLELDDLLQERGDNFTAFYDALSWVNRKYNNLVDCKAETQSNLLNAEKVGFEI